MTRKSRRIDGELSEKGMRRHAWQKFARKNKKRLQRARKIARKNDYRWTQ